MTRRWLRSMSILLVLAGVGSPTAAADSHVTCGADLTVRPNLRAGRVDAHMFFLEIDKRRLEGSITLWREQIAGAEELRERLAGFPASFIHMTPLSVIFSREPMLRRRIADAEARLRAVVEEKAACALLLEELRADPDAVIEADVGPAATEVATTTPPPEDAGADLDGSIEDAPRVFLGDGRFGLQYQEPGLRCQVRDRILDIKLVLEPGGAAFLDFPRSPQTEGSAPRFKNDVLTTKVRCFMQDEQRIYGGSWTSNGDGTIDAVIAFGGGAGTEPQPLPIMVDGGSPAAAWADHRIATSGTCPGSKWSAKKVGTSRIKTGKSPPKAPSFRCYLFDFTLIEDSR